MATGEKCVRHAVKPHLPIDELPIEWAVAADGIIYTAQIPINADGSIEAGSIEKQADLALGDFRRQVAASRVRNRFSLTDAQV